MRRPKISNTVEERIFHGAMILSIALVSIGLLYLVYYFFNYICVVYTGRGLL